MKNAKITQCALGLSALCSTGLAADASAGQKPHIILIMTDQQRADAMACAGNKAIYTPNLDKLAEDGNIFSHAYSSVPSSTPARAGLLTGMSPWRHGMLGYAQPAEHYPCEKPRILRRLGYTTIGIGKMHWHPQANNRGLHNLILDESIRVHSPYFKSDYRKWFDVKALGLSPDVTGLGWNAHGGKAYQLPECLHPTAWTGRVALDTIKGYQGDKPLYLKVSFARPHSPFDPPQRVLDKADKYVEAPQAPMIGEWVPDAWKKKNDPVKDPEAFIGNFSSEYTANSRRHYYASITFIDEQIGEIIQALKDKGMYDNALIFFVSDHGEMLGDHCLWRKSYAYEGSSRIPFILKLPKGYDTHIKPGQQIDQVVELRDVLPTMMDINGMKRPKIMDGLSLLEIYKNKNPQWRRYLDLEHAVCYYRDNYWTALTDGKIKYIRFMFSGKEQLFDLEKDPHEMKELSQEPAYQQKLLEMRAEMVAHLTPRGEEWVKDGEIQKKTRNQLYSSLYPGEVPAVHKAFDATDD